MVCFKDYNSANECRINMNQKKIKNKSIRIVWDERDFLQKNKDNKKMIMKKLVIITKIQIIKIMFKLMKKLTKLMKKKRKKKRKKKTN